MPLSAAYVSLSMTAPSKQSAENDVGKLCGIKGGLIPHSACKCIFQKSTGFDYRTSKVGTGEIAIFNLALILLPVTYPSIDWHFKPIFSTPKML
jgi:hypothetical protein